MKRILCVTLALLLLCPILLLPAAAAEPKEYVFEYVEPVAPLSDDFDFSSRNAHFECSDIVPDGYYRFTLVCSGETYVSPVFLIKAWEYTSFGPVMERSNLFRSPVLFDSVSFLNSVGSLISWPDISISVQLSKIYDGDNVIDSYSQLRIISGVDTVISSELWSAKLTLVNPIAESMTDSFSKNPNAPFSDILSLFPIVLPVLVSFISIRKAISYVHSRLKDA